MPNIRALGATNRPVPANVNSWFAEAILLVEQLEEVTDFVTIRSVADRLGTVRSMETDEQSVAAIMYRALKRAEMLAPAGIQGNYIPAGQTFDAFAAVGKVLSRAKSHVLFSACLMSSHAAHPMASVYGCLLEQSS
jgi:hypothetical protein